MRKMKLSVRNAVEGYALLLPLLIGCAVFYAVPFLLVARKSVYSGTFGGAQEIAAAENYRGLLENGAFRLAMGNTVKFLALALPLMILLSFAIALMLKDHAQKHSALKSVLLLPYIMPVVGSVALVELLFAETGLVNQGLHTLGLPVADWLHSQAAFWVVLGLYLWKNAGYSVILLLSGLVTIPKEHYDAAELDGGTFWQQLRYITVPQMWYSVFFTTVFSLINAFQCFREIFLIGGVHPHDSVYMLQHFINNTFDSLNYTKLAVASVLLLILLTVLAALAYRWVLKKEAYRE